MWYRTLTPQMEPKRRMKPHMSGSINQVISSQQTTDVSTDTVAFRFAVGLGTSDGYPQTMYLDLSWNALYNLKQQAATPPQKTCLTSSISLHGQCYPKLCWVRIKLQTHCIEP